MRQARQCWSWLWGSDGSSAIALTRWVPERRLIGIAAAVAVAGLVAAATGQVPWQVYSGFAIMGPRVLLVSPLALGIVGRIVPERHCVAAITQASVIGYLGVFGVFVGSTVIGVTPEILGIFTAFPVVYGCFLVIPLVLLPWIAWRRAKQRRVLPTSAKPAHAVLTTARIHHRAPPV
ncbi:MAG: hypothetical protein GDA36_09860, partial [Rhodobacteraceae bacterium]|nr:hypothetical protein [Paracoccaceae bacterium]